jgi:TonB family protein
MNTGIKWGLTLSAALHAGLLLSPPPEIITDREAPGRLIAASLLRVESPVSDGKVGKGEMVPPEKAEELNHDSAGGEPERQEEKVAVQALKTDTREEVVQVKPDYKEVMPDREENTSREEPKVEMKDTAAGIEGKTIEHLQPAKVVTLEVGEDNASPHGGTTPAESNDGGGVGMIPPKGTDQQTAGGRAERGVEKGMGRDEQDPGEKPMAVRRPARTDPMEVKSDPAHLLALIRSRILAARRYPELARRKGWQGRAAVRFRIDREGRPDFLELVESSGFTVLDKASLKAVDMGAPYPPMEGWITVPIVFRLKG